MTHSDRNKTSTAPSTPSAPKTTPNPTKTRTSAPVNPGTPAGAATLTKPATAKHSTATNPPTNSRSPASSDLTLARPGAVAKKAPTARGQTSLPALGVALVAVVLVPVLLASMQLGYHDNVRATADYDDPTADALRVLERAVATESAAVPRQFVWAANDSAVTCLRTDLRPSVDRLRTSRVEDGVYYPVAYNGTAAGEWAAANCPSGPGRQFGGCHSDRGVAVQNRVNRTQSLTVGFDVTTTTDRGETSARWWCGRLADRSIETWVSVELSKGENTSAMAVNMDSSVRNQ